MVVTEEGLYSFGIRVSQAEMNVLFQAVTEALEYSETLKGEERKTYEGVLRAVRSYLEPFTKSKKKEV
jgi:hypothetical protein